MTRYVLSPLALVTRSDKSEGVVVHAGDGYDRQRLDIDEGPAGESLLAWVLARVAPESAADLTRSLAATIGLDPVEAESVVSELMIAHILVDDHLASAVANASAPWIEHGWDDAAMFHRSTFGQRFDPDTLGEFDYADYYRWLSANPEITGPQPPVVKEGAGARPVPGHRETTSRSMCEVFSRSAPINRFSGPHLRHGQLLGIIGDAFAAQRTIGGLLGDHLLKEGYSRPMKLR